MEVGARIVGDRRLDVTAAKNEQLLRSANALEADDVAVEMQVDFAPHTDRERRHGCCGQAFGRRPFFPKGVIEVVAAGLKRVIVWDLARRAGFWILVQIANQIPPADGIVAGNAAGVSRRVIGIDVAVVRCDACEMRRMLRCHEPL